MGVEGMQLQLIYTDNKKIQIHKAMSEPTTLQKVCQCICCSYKACGVAQCIDIWHACEAYELAYLFCDSCCWSFCAPLFIDCKLGDSGKAMEGCLKCFKYCIFGCALYVVGCCDGIYNCVQVAQLACSTGVKGYADLTKNTEWIANKVKEALGLETGNEPLKSMGTFLP